MVNFDSQIYLLIHISTIEAYVCYFIQAHLPLNTFKLFGMIN